MKNRLRNWIRISFFGIDRRIFLNIVMVVALASVIVAGSFYQLLTGLWRTQYEESFLQRNGELTEALGSHLDDICSLLTNFSINHETVRMLLGRYVGPFERYQCMLAVDNYIRNLGATHGLDNILLVAAGAEWTYSVRYGEYTLSEPEREALLGSLSAIGRETVFALTDDYSPPWAAGEAPQVAAVLRVFQMGRTLGYVVLPIEPHTLDILLGGTQEENSVAVLGRGDRLLYQSPFMPRDILGGLQGLAPGEVRYSSYNDHVYIAAVSEPAAGTRLVTLRRSYDMSLSERRNYTYFVGIMLLILSVTIAATLLISHRIAKPVKLIMNEVRQVSRDNLNFSPPPGLDDEIMGDLFSSIQEMVRRIAQLVADLSREQEMTKTAEIHALQQQINPHFIYNILGTVDSIAEVYGCGQISQIVQNLSDMLRYSMNMGYANTAALGEEWAHLMNYIEIQRVCKGDKFTFSSELAPGLEQARVLRLILQPLVENSFTHGVESHSQFVSISLRARLEGGDIAVSVTDDGGGMAPEKLARVRRSIYEEPAEPRDDGGTAPQGHGLALRSVHWRLRLQYGGACGLTIDSAPGGGIAVTLRFPYEM